MGVLVLMGAHFTKPSTLNGVCTVQVGKMPKEQEARVGGGWGWGGSISNSPPADAKRL